MKNVRIIKTQLGKEGHGIPSAALLLDFGGGVVMWWGGYDLREGGNSNFIFRVLDTLKIEYWENLSGTCCRLSDDKKGIGHIIEDSWYFPEKEYELSELKKER